MGLYEERMNRINAAIALEPVDKIPFSTGGPAFMAAYEGVLLKDYVNDMDLNCTTNIKFTQEFNADCTQAEIFTPKILCAQWLSEVQLPGEGVVPENDLWQIHETERMTQDDYDKILEMGYAAWTDKFLHEQYGDMVDRAQQYFDYLPTAAQRYREAGIPSICDGIFQSPFEQICGARSLEPFVMDDLFDIPEKVEEVFEVIHKHNMETYTAMCESPVAKPNGVWVGGWRGTPSMLNKEMFEKYSWKYMKQYIDLCIQYDVIPVCHLDASWDLGLEYFKEMPAKKMVIALDGKTDIFKAKEILGGHSCLMGDVPAEMLAFGTPEDTYAYCMKLIKEVGPEGYIMCSGCDVPYNANPENVKQMPKSVTDFANANK